MRRFLLVFFALIVAAGLGAYFWTRAAQNRILETVDRANEEIERLWASDFNRPSLFPAPPPEADVDLDAGAEDSVEAEEGEDEQPFVDATDATSYYRQAETELAQLAPRDREVIQAALLNPLDPESVTRSAELLERFAKALALVEKGLAQSRCTPWDTPAHGQRLRTPQPEVHRFLFSLFIARSEQAEAAGRPDDAAFDALRAIAFSQDLARNAPLASRFHFSGFQVAACQRLQGLMARAPVGSGTTEKLVKGLATLDEIEPTALQTLHFERLVLLSGFGQVATAGPGPGAFDLWAGIFDLVSTHQLAAAAEMTRAVVEELTASADEPLAKALPVLTEVSERLARSTNPLVSSLMPNLVRFKLTATDASRQLRLAQLVSALQAHRQATGDFPTALQQLKGQTLRRIPADPTANEPFSYRPADVGTPAKLSSAGLENRLASAECVIEVPPAVPSAEGVTPELPGAARPLIPTPEQHPKMDPGTPHSPVIGQPYHGSVKSYAPRASIAGVEIARLRRFVDDRGFFLEIYRKAANHPGTGELADFFRGVDVAQMNFSIVNADDHVKGMHYHLQQKDIWFCPPPSKMKIVLLDCREDSPTYASTQVIVAGDGNDVFVKIPEGVAHGYRPLTNPCALLYIVTKTFDLQDPDEFRVPWDHPSVRDLWATPNG